MGHIYIEQKCSLPVRTRVHNPVGHSTIKMDSASLVHHISDVILIKEEQERGRTLEAAGRMCTSEHLQYTVRPRDTP